MSADIIVTGERPSLIELAVAGLVETVERADAERAARERAPHVHRFATTTDARAAIDREEIPDGDVLVVEPENAVGFLVVTLPVAVTANNGAFAAYRALRKPGREYLDGAYTASVDVAEETALALGYTLGEEAGYQNGDRAVCPDGQVRTADFARHLDPADGRRVADVHMTDGAVFPENECRKITEGAITDARKRARRAADTVLTAPQATPEWASAIDTLSESVRYLRKADPDTAAELDAGHGSQLLVIESFRTLVDAGDVLHVFGTRQKVLDAGVRDTHEGPQWWARLCGVDAKDRQRTYREPWTLGLPFAEAVWDLVTVERRIPRLAA